MNGVKAEGSAEGSAGKDARKKRWLKRQALQISTMLPEDPDEARQVLMYALELQRGFLAEKRDDEGVGARSTIVPLDPDGRRATRQ